jgi:hypothetical protein
VREPLVEVSPRLACDSGERGVTPVSSLVVYETTYDRNLLACEFHIVRDCRKPHGLAICFGILATDTNLEVL